MSRQDQGHPSSDSETAEGLVEVLTRWETSGGHWRVLTSDPSWIEVGLFTCDGGEQMSRVGGARTAALAGYLRGRTSTTD